MNGVEELTIKKNSNILVKKWRNFTRGKDEYDLSHLNAHWVEFNIDSKIMRFYVTYSHHCFAKDAAGINDCDSWIYPYPADERKFNIERYNLSLALPKLISEIDSAITYHARREQYAFFELKGESMESKVYQVVFSVFKFRAGEFRMHIPSAYLLDKAPKIKKVAFKRIASNLLKGKKLPPEPK